jgi:hypothetical protein
MTLIQPHPANPDARFSLRPNLNTQTHHPEPYTSSEQANKDGGLRRHVHEEDEAWERTIDAPLIQGSPLDPVREAFFRERLGDRLLWGNVKAVLGAVREWEDLSCRADAEVLRVVSAWSQVKGEVTGWDEDSGFKGPGAEGGCLKLFWLAQSLWEAIKAQRLQLLIGEFLAAKVRPPPFCWWRFFTLS